MKNNFIGHKTLKIYNEFLINFFPPFIDTYIEPFGGSFAVSTYLSNKPNKLIYNDIIDYNLDIKADEIYHKDYKEIFDMFDNKNSFIYIDAPYFGKEQLYGLKKFDKIFHKKLKGDISELVSKFVVSYEDNDYIRELYSDFKIHKYTGSNQILRNEIVITKS